MDAPLIINVQFSIIGYNCLQRYIILQNIRKHQQSRTVLNSSSTSCVSLRLVKGCIASPCCFCLGLKSTYIACGHTQESFYIMGFEIHSYF